MNNYEQAYQKCIFKHDSKIDNKNKKQAQDYKNDADKNSEKSNYDKAYQKCIFKQNAIQQDLHETPETNSHIYDNIKGSERVYEEDIVCPKCESVHVNEQSTEPSLNKNSIIKTYECGDCNCRFQCELTPVVTDITVYDE